MIEALGAAIGTGFVILVGLIVAIVVLGAVCAITDREGKR